MTMRITAAGAASNRVTGRRGGLIATIGAIAAGCAIGQAAEATITVVTPNQNLATPGTNNVNSPFGAAGSAQNYVMQVQYAASMFSDIAIGSQLSSIGFRLYTGAATNTRALSYTNFGIQVGSAARSITNLSRTFSDNLGADTILARTGALDIARHALLADSCTSRRCNPKIPTNSFFMINLTTPYTYAGGDIVFTFTSTLAQSTIGQIVSMDAVDPYLVSTVSTIASSSTGALPTRGTAVNFAFAPILNLSFEPPLPSVPEPASWAMMLCGFGLVGSALRRTRARVTFA